MSGSSLSFLCTVKAWSLCTCNMIGLVVLTHNSRTMIDCLIICEALFLLSKEPPGVLLLHTTRFAAPVQCF